MTDNHTHHRHPAHPPPIRRHNAPIILLVTTCVLNKAVRLDNEERVASIIEACRRATHWRVGEYVVMPDHVHFFCVPGVREYPPVRRWVGFWKREVGKIKPELKSVFMEDCWDTQMRNREHYNEKLSYVRKNPERKNLVTWWNLWPYRGNVFDIGWL